MCTVKGEKGGVKISVFMDLRQDLEDLPFLGWKEATRGSRLESDNGGMNEDCRDGRQWKLRNGWMRHRGAAARTHGNLLDDSEAQT